MAESSRTLTSLRGEVHVLPSLLLCDFGHLAREIERLESAGVRALHLDVMDGHFVPNFTYGMTIVEAVRRCTSMPLDVHLMIDQPRRYLAAFRNAGADHLTIHLESTSDAAADLQAIRELGATAGLALNPQTPVETLQDVVAGCDLVLIMSVQAGFGGQSFREESLRKLRDARQRYGTSLLWQMDGGIHAGNIDQCAQAGADLLVVGSAIFAANDYTSAVHRLQSAMRHAS